MFLNKRQREVDKAIESDVIAFDAASDEPLVRRSIISFCNAPS